MRRLKMGKRAGDRRAFTLVELLVISFVIVLCAVIFLPALSRAGDNDASARCRQNLGILGQAFLMYAEDWDGWVAGHRHRDPDGRISYWYQTLGREGYLEIGSDFEDRQMTWCPSSPPERNGRRAMLEQSYATASRWHSSPVSYPRYNYATGTGGNDMDLWRIGAMPDPSAFVWLADSIDAYNEADGPVPRQFYYFIVERDRDFSNEQVGVGLRHDGRANLWMADGRVESAGQEKILEEMRGIWRVWDIEGTGHSSTEKNPLFE